MADINHTLRAGTTIPVPVDTTLRNPGQAADAAAVGREIARVETLNSRITVNGEQQDEGGDIKLEAGDIPTGVDERTVLQHITASEEAIDAMTEVLETAQQTLSDMESTMEALEGNVETIEGTLEEVVEAIPGISDNADAIEELQEAVSTLQTAAGNIDGIAPGVYNDYGVYAGYVDNASKRLVFFVPGRFKGRNVSIEATAAVTVRGVAGPLKPAKNSAGATIAAADFNAIGPGTGSASAMGFICTMTVEDAFYLYGSATVALTHTPVTVYGKFNITVS